MATSVDTCIEIGIDIGNTRSKWLAELNGAELISGVSDEPIENVPAAIKAALAAQNHATSRVSRIRIACVRNLTAKQQLAGHIHRVFGVAAEFAATAARSGGIINSYSDPEAMGVDRWCAIMAAASEARLSYEPCAFCVIDAGSAVTLDFVDASGRHQGGYITPGYSLQLNALLAGTQKVAANKLASVNSIAPGDNTTDAVHAGILSSMIAHVERGVAQFSAGQARAPAVFLAGGDAAALQHFSILTMLSRPLLVLHGLKVLLP